MARLTGGVAAVQVRASAVVVQDGENLHGSFMGADGVRDHGGELRYFPAVDEDAPLPDAFITALDRSADMLAATVKAAAFGSTAASKSARASSGSDQARSRSRGSMQP